MINYIDFELVVSGVSEHTGVPGEALLDVGIQTPVVVEARHLVIYLARKLTYKSMRQVAEKFGRQDHKMVWYAVNKLALKKHIAGDKTIEAMHYIIDKLEKQTGKALAQQV